MKPAATPGESIAYSTVWSAPLTDIPLGGAVKFHILWRKRLVEAFVVNFHGRYYAYVNHCVHAGTPLDWWPNEFFNADGHLLVCGTHGSLYKPDTGKCAGGPCAGGGLFPLHVRLKNHRIVVSSDK